MDTYRVYEDHIEQIERQLRFLRVGFEGRPRPTTWSALLGLLWDDDIKRGAVGTRLASMSNCVLEPTVYRVAIDPDTKATHVICFDSFAVAREHSVLYSDPGNLPLWMQRKLAVLQMLHVPPPPAEVPGVGVRIDEHSFWVEGPIAALLE